MFNRKNSSKNDKWRSLCIVDLAFKGVKEGEGKNRSFCCKVESYIKPDAENFAGLFMGTKQKMLAVSEKYETSIGFDETVRALLNPVTSELKMIAGVSE
ncbi:hypothetical protein H6G32_11375 [Cylindrospermum sp. FACHB-282]|nr:hypothetical protein [Cylindrospermum sp. FACHB-282]